MLKEHTSRSLFLKIAHLDLKDIKGFAMVHSQVDLSPDEADELAEAVQTIDRIKKEQRYYGSR